MPVRGEQWQTDAGPIAIQGVQFSGAMPGGHGSASFEVPVGSAYLAPHHTLYEGAWIEIFDDAHELYEGEVFSIKPSADGSGNHKLSVTCGGLISVAGKRADVSATWVHRGSAGWRRRMGTPDSLGALSFDNGVVDLRVLQGTAQSFTANTMDDLFGAVFVLDEGLSDDTISYVDIVADWSAQAESGFDWKWVLYAGPDPANYVATAVTATGTGSTGTAFTLTPAAGTKTLQLLFYYLDAVHTVADTRWVTFSQVDIYGQGRTTKPRIDEAMVSLATRTGLATSSVSESIGAMLDDLHVGEGKSPVTAAAALQTIAGLHSQPFDWGFWDERTFVCNLRPTVPANDAKVIVVGNDSPADSWDVAVYDEDVPDFVLVLYGNKDNPAYPEGWPRKLYRPYTPSDEADLKIEVLDYSQFILTDGAAMNIGDFVVGRDATAIPAGAVFDAHPMFADGGLTQGNNADPTSSYVEHSAAAAAGTVTNFAYTTASGWAGSDIPTDLACLVADGVNDYVTWGDLAACDFGTGAFSVRVYVRFPAVAPTVDFMPLFGKRDSAGQGWAIGVTSAMTLRGYVGTSWTDYRQQTGATVHAASSWKSVAMTYAGSGGDIVLYVDGVAETLTAAGAVGAWDVSSAAPLQLFRSHT